ncbi:Cyclin-SDS-like [Apostasia shenzhenica]|uniref:Cyclin-SDS-like n=1 Tax=Apostasia shenzhenica TaxID=1088818 RepID=A0A2I0A9I8_9ASPA|nr:Cyclin-SDS-like [Apostasia shenzhenica]
MAEMIPDLISKRSVSLTKRRATEVLAGIHTKKKLRSNIPRRKRVPAFSISGFSSNSYSGVDDEAESSSSCFNGEKSLGNSVEFNKDQKQPGWHSEIRWKKMVGSFRKDSSDDEFRRITRSYAKRKDLRLKAVEVRSIDRGIDSFSHSLTRGTKRSDPKDNAALDISVSGVSEISGNFPNSNLKAKDSSKAKISDISDSCLESIVSDTNGATVHCATGKEVSRLQLEKEISIQVNKAHELDLQSDLACPEELIDDGCLSDYSACNEMLLSEFESDILHGQSDEDSEVSLSDLIESPDYFSERSLDDSTPSVAFSILFQLWEQFRPSSFVAESNEKFQETNELSEEFILSRFPNKDDEESYQSFRSRERNETSLHDYANWYSTNTGFGDLIIGQRLLMVNWMLEHCQSKELQSETLFLGVNLMDRFLSRGYFQTERYLQLLGIACVTLATRLEENQPYNSIRQRSFKVGVNVYKRCEVVSMEWLLLEVLRFQCFLPTIHNFLWFYLKAARASAEVEDLCRHLAILSLLDHSILCFWPSTVAAGLAILACIATDNDSHCNNIMETHVRRKTDDLSECIKSLDWLVKYASMRTGTEQP